MAALPPLILATIAGLGVGLLVSSGRNATTGRNATPDDVERDHGVTPPATRAGANATRTPGRSRRRPRVASWLTSAGLGHVRTHQFVATTFGVGLAGALGAWLLFGGVLAPAMVGLASATTPVATWRRRRAVDRRVVADAWPAVLEAVRLRTGAAGLALPQALFGVADLAPPAMRDALGDAGRTWALRTDFAAALDVLKDRLADATTDVVCETLLMAYELGGRDVDRRLARLAADRRRDQTERKDATARLAGARFSRRFVLIVPLGMATAGLAIGDGRAAYETPAGQLTVLVALGVTAACWVWAGRYLGLPDEPRVFAR